MSIITQLKYIGFGFEVVFLNPAVSWRLDTGLGNKQQRNLLLFYCQLKSVSG